jgi:ribosomal protein S18 acetylase RimI-like enzyme
MTPALQFEILDLRHFSANSLRPVLEHETRLWNDRLQWDYRASADLLLQYLDSRVLPGYVAIEDGRISGYVFCIYEENKAVIGDAYAIPSRQGLYSATEVEIRLLDHIVELLTNSPGVDRIESQLLIHPHGAHVSVFHRAGFEIFPRLFMHRDLTPSFAGLAPDSLMASLPGPLPAGFELRGWRDEDFTAAGRLIAACYHGHLDSQINDQYRSVAGSLRFLHNVVRFPGCGTFDPVASKVVVKSGTRDLAAILLCSRVRSDVAHITQICAARQYRGLGLGTLLLKTCAAELRKRHYSTLTLTVTEGNTEAVSLYRAQGFATKHTFDAMVWNQPKSESKSRIGVM